MDPPPRRRRPRDEAGESAPRRVDDRAARFVGDGILVGHEAKALAPPAAKGIEVGTSVVGNLAMEKAAIVPVMITVNGKILS